MGAQESSYNALIVIVLLRLKLLIQFQTHKSQHFILIRKHRKRIKLNKMSQLEVFALLMAGR